MEFLLIAAAVGALLWAFPPLRGIFKVWVLLSLVLVWLLDSAAGDSLGD